MCQFMADYISADGEAIEELTVAVTIDHLQSIPEGVVVLVVIVDRRLEQQAVVVHGVSVINVEGKIVSVSAVFVSRVDGDILSVRVAFVTYFVTREVNAVAGVKDSPVFSSRCIKKRKQRDRLANSTLAFANFHRTQSKFPELGFFCHSLVNVRWQNKANMIV